MPLQSYSLIVPAWYPTAANPLTGIFVQKHVQLISTFVKCIVLYAVPAAGANFPQQLKKETGEAIEFTFYYKPQRIRLLNQLAQMAALWRGYNHIVAEYGKPAVIHNHIVFPAGYFAWAVSKLQNIPLLITEHWSGYCPADGRYERLSFLHKLITKAAFSRAKAVSVVSSFLKTSIQELGLPNATSNVLITSNVLKDVPTPAANTFNPTRPKALFIGNLNDHEKNVSGLIEASTKVAQRFPGFTLTLIGGGNEKQLLEAKAATAGLLNTNIIFKGNVANSQLHEHYGAADFFILNSNFETFNIAAAEALMHGLPVVSTRCGGPEEFVNESNGMLTEVNNPAKLAEAVIRLIENYNLYNRAAIAGQMRGSYSNRVVTEQFKKMYSYI